MSVPLLSGKIFLLITGASQGIGRQIAESFAPFLGDGSLILLLARNLNGLKETADKLPKSLNVRTVSIDLSIATFHNLKDVIGEALNGISLTEFEKAIIVHNAASIGDLTKTTNDMTDFNIWRKYYDLNVFSPAVLNGVFMNLFNDDTKVPRIVINLTSYSAIQPFATTGYYCSGKAAREMFFKVFAIENPKVNVLNYSPGPVDTDMLKTLTINMKKTTSNDSSFKNHTSKRSVLTTEKTVNRLLEILKLQNYKSGDHVDYYNN